MIQQLAQNNKSSKVECYLSPLKNPRVFLFLSFKIAWEILLLLINNIHEQIMQIESSACVTCKIINSLNFRTKVGNPLYNIQRDAASMNIRCA